MRSVLQRAPSNLALPYARIEASDFLWSTTASGVFGVTVLTRSTPEEIQAGSGAMEPYYVSGAGEDGTRTVILLGSLEDAAETARLHNPNDLGGEPVLTGWSEDRMVYDFLRRVEFGLHLHLDLERRGTGYVHDFALRSAATHAMTGITTMRAPTRTTEIASVPRSLYGVTLALRYGSALGTPHSVGELARDCGCEVHGTVMPAYGEYLDVASAELAPVVDFLERLLYGEEKPLTSDPLTMARIRSKILGEEL